MEKNLKGFSAVDKKLCKPYCTFKNTIKLHYRRDNLEEESDSDDVDSNDDDSDYDHHDDDWDSANESD